MDGQVKLHLYEALELRADYDARIKTLKECLPETRTGRTRFTVLDDDGGTRPSPDFDPQAARKQLRGLEFKRRKLNPRSSKPTSATGSSTPANR